MQEHAPFHGSDLELMEAHYGIPKEQIVSFSANVNPLGLSPKLRQSLVENIDQIMTYPDREYTQLRASISRYCGAPMEQILVGGGATELISLFIQNLRPKKALLINPTYSEYARELALAGGTLLSYDLLPALDFRLDVDDLQAALDDSFDLLILCNPNNPTGSALHQKDLRRILTHCRTHQIQVMIDETYVEFSTNLEDITSIPLLGEFENLFVLRGISKFFAAPGLRLGYGMTANASLLAYINAHKNPWSLNALAAVSGCPMFEDVSYIQTTRQFTQKEMGRLCQILRQEQNLHVYAPEANFILLRLLKEGLTSGMVFEHAIRQGFMLRDCASFPGLGNNHIRFCLNTPEQNDRLIAVLQALL